MSEEKKTVEPELLRGFRDYLPAQVNARQKMLDTIKKVYERYGFVPLETPALEYLLTLIGYGEDSNKLIFKFQNPEKENVALRYDLTVSLARVVAQYPDLPKPFRRYQVGPVWRADKPGPGRFREFYQFDLDTVGSTSMAADAEIISGMYDTLRALGIQQFQVKFSDRKVLNTLLEYAGIPAADGHSVFRVLDKIEKIGLENVELELSVGRIDVSGDKIPGLGLNNAQIGKIKEFLLLPRGKRREVIDALRNLFKGIPLADEATGELTEICNSLEALEIPEEFVFIDLSVARGLDYYTGPVFEASLTNLPEFGSVFGGGRYDGLVERFLGKKIPATGASIGVDRLFAAMQKLELVQLTPSTAKVLVTVMDKTLSTEYQKITRELRMAGINTELYLGEEKSLSKQLQYANEQKIPVAVIIGGDELAKNEVTIKDLFLGAQLQDKKKAGMFKERDEWLQESRKAQTSVPRKDLVEKIRGLI
jgi:histidyl-tRNA synthetase